MADLNIINVGGVDYNIADATARSNVSGKAPINHASSATTYGKATGSLYGHVRLSDTFRSVEGYAADGIAASQGSVYRAFMASRVYHTHRVMISPARPGVYVLGTIVDHDYEIAGTIPGDTIISVVNVSGNTDIISRIVYVKENSKYTVQAFVWNAGNYQLSEATDDISFDVFSFDSEAFT